MNWDPSMATTSCQCCGRGIEAWISICEDCEEKASLIATKYDKFKTQFERLIRQGEELHEELREINILQEAQQFKFYLLNRMQNFLDGNEIFEFDSIDKQLKEIIGEED